MRALSVLAIAVLAAGAASAQPNYGGRGGRESATLYQFPNFQGQAYTLNSEATNLPRSINDVAMSARFEGRWQVCADSDFGGHCVELSGDVRNLADYGLTTKVSSLRPVGGRGGGWDQGGGRPGGGYGGGGYGGGSPSGRGADGARTVFFPYPRLGGRDVAASQRSADAFCRANRLGPSVWFDSGERTRDAVDGDGRYAGDSNALRDLLCRK